MMLDAHKNEETQASIEPAAQLLLMLTTGHIKHGFSGCKELDWERGSMEAFVPSHSSHPRRLGRQHQKVEEYRTKL